MAQRHVAFLCAENVMEVYVIDGSIRLVGPIHSADCEELLSKRQQECKATVACMLCTAAQGLPLSVKFTPWPWGCAQR